MGNVPTSAAPHAHASASRAEGDMPAIVDSSTDSEVMGSRMLPLASMQHNPSIFAVAVRIMRTSKLMCIRSASEAAGISEHDWRRIENGERPNDVDATQQLMAVFQ